MAAGFSLPQTEDYGAAQSESNGCAGWRNGWQQFVRICKTRVPRAISDGAAIGIDAADHRSGVRAPVRSISDFAEVLGVTYGGAMNNVRELIAQGVAEEMGASYAKLILFPGVLAALQVGK